MRGDDRKKDKELLLGALVKAGAHVLSDKKIQCPFHSGEKHGYIREGESGDWLYRCWPCDFHGSVYDVEERAGIRTEHKGAEQRSSEPPKPVESFDSWQAIRTSLFDVADVYPYTNPDSGKIDFAVYRMEPKDKKKWFAPCSINPASGKWEKKIHLAQSPLFNRTWIKKADTVVVVEGEKCAKALKPLGLCGVTSPGGHAAPDKADWTPLAGKKVYLWPDYDQPNKQGFIPGQHYIQTVAKILDQLEPRPQIFVIRPQDLGLEQDGSDVADYLAAHPGNADEQRGLIQLVFAEASEPWGESRPHEFIRHLEKIFTGQYRAIAWPWPCLTRVARALYPETCTVICGDAGSGKTLFVLEAAAFWVAQGIKIALYELEKSRNFHMLRALAQMESDSRMADPDLVEIHQVLTAEAYVRHKPLHDALAYAMDDAPDKQMASEKMIDWIFKKAESGCKIIIIDPVTAMNKGNAPWLSDNAVLLDTRAMLAKHGSRLILVNHPANADQGRMAGGAAYTLFSDTILWLKRPDQPEEVTLKTKDGNREMIINRRLYLKKCRIGGGGGREIGYYFEPDSFRFAEQGVIVQPPKRGKAR